MGGREDDRDLIAPASSRPDGGRYASFVARTEAGKTRFIGFTGHKSPAIHLAMLEAARDHGVHFDTVQMPLNAMDAHYRSFERNVLPVLLEQDIAPLGMKSMGSGILLQSGGVSAPECLRYALGLPVSVVITGCDSMRILDQALEIGTKLTPMTDEERRDLLARTRAAAERGRFEKYKSTQMFDGTSKHPRWLDTAQL